MTGATTSGCVRARLVDAALQYGFRPAGSRSFATATRMPHEANLHDVDAKYGGVVSVEETLQYLEKVREETDAPR